MSYSGSCQSCGYGGTTSTANYQFNSYGSGISVDYDIASTMASQTYTMSTLEAMTVDQEMGHSGVPSFEDHKPRYGVHDPFDEIMNAINNIKKSNYYFSPDPFLHEHRPITQFIEEAGDIEDLVREAFEKTTGKAMPEDITIRICDKEELQEIHEKNGGRWSEGIMGFAINKKPGISNVFVRKGPLDKVMLTLGHEIGHCLSLSLPNKQNEEAKAFAFSLAWMETIKKNNIGNLAHSINLDAPAQNGLHDIALDFVLGKKKEGLEAISLFEQLKKGLLHVMHNGSNC